MELGNFLGKLKGQEKVEPKKFLALVLTDEVIQASVWHVAGFQTEIVAIGTPVEWDGDSGTTGELITAVDATISSAVEGLSDEPNSVILGIPHTWTDKSNILGVKKDLIAKIKKELELDIIGYVVITDSILNYLKMKEGTPTTSILIQVSREELTLVLIRLGRIEAIETIGRGDDIVEDVTEGIIRFKTKDNLPSRIILFNSMHDLSEIIQNLLSVDWPSEFNFLHIPKIESLPKDVAIRALSVAGGTEVAKSMGFTISETIPTHAEDMKPIEVRHDPLAESVSDPIIEDSILPPDLELLSPEEIGFTELTSIVVAESPRPPTDITSTSLPARGEAEKSLSKNHHHLHLEIPKFKLPSFTLPKVKFNLRKIKSHWWIIGWIFVVLGVFVFWLVWLMPNAIVTVRVLPKTLEENIEITLSTTEPTISFSDRIIPASIEYVSESGDKMMATTGKKIIGDPSIGVVTIYNRTSSNKVLPKGTVISASSLKFTLDQDVTVASKSAGSDYIDVPGKANVSVTAQAIGREGDLPASTEFTIMSFGKDSYVAKNDSAFTGGTSEEVRVVGKEDQKKLVEALVTDLLTSLTNKSKENSSPGTGIYLIEDSVQIDTVSYSAKIGETATNLTTNLTIKAGLLKYKTEDVTTLVNSSIDQAVPVGYIRANLPSTVDLVASSISESGDTVKGNAKVQVSLLPVINNSALQSSISGKNRHVTERILASEIPGYQSAEIQILPNWIPTRLKFIPINSSHITIQTKPGI